MRARIVSERDLRQVMRKASRRKRAWTPHEDREAVALIQWRDLHRCNTPELKLLLHIPNQRGTRSITENVRLKRMGVRAGVADYFLPVARGSYHGLFLELKAKGGRQADSQAEFELDVTEENYGYALAYSWEEARDRILGYLMLPNKENKE